MSAMPAIFRQFRIYSAMLWQKWPELPPNPRPGNICCPLPLPRCPVAVSPHRLGVRGNWSPGERCDIFTITGNLEYFISGSASHPSEPLTLSPPLSLSHVETTWNNTFLTRLHGHLVEWVYRFFWVPRKRTLVHGAVNLWISKQCS